MQGIHAAMSLHGQVALVTGATRGIGAEILKKLGSAQATVIGTATTQEGAAKIQTQIDSLGLQGRGIVLNVADGAAIDSALADIEAKEGAVSILVNNAGITRDTLLLRMKPEDWDQVIHTNLTSVFRLSKGVLKGMMKLRHGRIINIASVVGLTGNAGQANYSAAKAGIMGFTKTLAKEVASRNITANVIAPGFIDTDMTKAMPEAARTALMSQIPLGRLGTAEDIAFCVWFLASQAGAYITGETISVNGGMVMS